MHRQNQRCIELADGHSVSIVNMTCHAHHKLTLNQVYIDLRDRCFTTVHTHISDMYNYDERKTGSAQGNHRPSADSWHVESHIWLYAQHLEFPVFSFSNTTSVLHCQKVFSYHYIALVFSSCVVLFAALFVAVVVITVVVAALTVVLVFLHQADHQVSMGGE